MNTSSKPNWYEMLPQHMKPEENKIEKLEKLRIECDLPHDLFFMGIGVSPWAVIKAQEATLERFKKELPNATEKELWRGVLFSRLEIKLKCPSPLDPLAEVLLDKIKNLDNIMANINSFDELVEYIVQMDKSILEDSGSIQKQIDKILLE